MVDPKQSKRDQSGYLSEDTIAALATPTGGAIAIVRVSGPRALEALQALIGAKRFGEMEERCISRVQVRDSFGDTIDDAMVSYFIAPRSFTGEDSVEWFIHGNLFVAQRLLEELGKLEVRQALPGEFSFRAVRNGKMDLSQAQALADLIAARNDRAVHIALEKMSGTQSKLIHDTAESLRRVAMMAEVGIDFSDQDVDELGLDRLKKDLRGVISILNRLRLTYDRGILLQEGIGVAFVGLPNAGKSSLFNAILGEDRSIVSDVAGTTRDVVREQITLRGRRGTLTFRFEDTAGLRHSEDTVEKIGIDRTLQAARNADLIIFVVDGSDEFKKAREIWRQVGQPVERSIGVITKADRATETQLENGEAFLKDLGLQIRIRTSASTSEGIAETAEAMVKFCEGWVGRTPGEVILTRLDHCRAVEGCLDNLNRALDAESLDLFAADVRHGLAQLEPLVGRTVPDDILGRIFSEFCIGK